MLRLIIILALIALTTVGNPLLAFESKDYSPNGLTYSRLSELKSLTEYNGAIGFQNSQDQKQTQSQKTFHYPLVKSPKRALLFSSLIPGLGEFYSKAYIKSAVFVCAEVALWIAYSNYIKEGDRIEDEFKLFADQNWDYDRYAVWISEHADIEKTHEIPFNSDVQTKENINKTQQYYEMIGKYDQFFYGWEDALYDEYGKRKGLRMDYMDLREDSNKELKKATTMVSLVIMNHLVSAVDAAWSAIVYNKKAYEAKQGKLKTSLHFKPIPLNNDIHPALALQVRW
ncbi:hypothetical protein JXJ21_20400 [candidate division KSB1 bacterium]|nr:hypothetical protein [candidate division KSB1 bacterium]